MNIVVVNRRYRKTGKTPVLLVSFLIKLQASGCNFIKKETLAQVFSCEFCEISKNIFFTEHLWATPFQLAIHFVFYKQRSITAKRSSKLNHFTITIILFCTTLTEIPYS